MKIIKGLVYTDKQYIELLEKENKEIKSQKEICDNLLKTTDYINNHLQQIIDKAIEYIEEHSLNYNGECEIDLEVEECKDLYKILKGERK